MPLGPNTIDTLAKTLTREELISFWKDLQQRLDLSYTRLSEADKLLATYDRLSDDLLAKLPGEHRNDELKQAYDKYKRG